MIGVAITTYNQAAYIGQCVESALSQRLEDELRVYVADDCSTDTTLDILADLAAEHSALTVIRREHNMGLTANTAALLRLMHADGCEFIAMLDGDDYYTDPLKLQKQLDYMKSHPACGLCHTGYSILSGDAITPMPKEAPEGNLQGRYGLQGADVMNCTVMLRASLLPICLTDDLLSQNFIWLDYPMYGLLAMHAEFGYIKERTAVWRKHESVSQPRSTREVLRYREERCRMWRYLEQLYPGGTGCTSAEADGWLGAEKLNLAYLSGDYGMAHSALSLKPLQRDILMTLKVRMAATRISFGILSLLIRTKKRP